MIFSIDITCIEKISLLPPPNAWLVQRLTCLMAHMGTFSFARIFFATS